MCADINPLNLYPCGNLCPEKKCKIYLTKRKVKYTIKLEKIKYMSGGRKLWETMECV